MRIAIIWKNDYPWDVRVEKIARSLLADGHEVHILCANAQGRSTRETLDGLQIRRLPATASRRLNAIISIPFYLNPFWFLHASEAVSRERIDLIIVRDLPLILVGGWLKHRFRVPLILDMAENYAAMYGSVALDIGGLRSWAYRFARSQTLMEFVERRAMTFVDHTLVVVEESAKRLMEQYGIPRMRLSVVSNTPRLESLDPPAPSAGRRPQSWLQLIYTGYVQKGRGLDVLPQALRLLRDRGLDVRLRIVGDGNYVPGLAKLMREKALDDAIEFTGWVTHTEVAKYVHEADVGVIPHPKNDHTDTTVPNKLFDYMASGRPVVVSNAAPLQRIVTQERCGCVFKAGSAESLADALAYMSKDEAMRQEMGRNGADAVRQRFNWEHDAEVLRDTVARFASVERPEPQRT